MFFKKELTDFFGICFETSKLQWFRIFFKFTIFFSRFRPENFRRSLWLKFENSKNDVKGSIN